MDVIGFTDEEITELNSPTGEHADRQTPRRTATKTSGQRRERVSLPSTKQAKVIGALPAGASLSKPAPKKPSPLRETSPKPDEEEASTVLTIPSSGHNGAAAADVASSSVTSSSVIPEPGNKGDEPVKSQDTMLQREDDNPSKVEGAEDQVVAPTKEDTIDTSKLTKVQQLQLEQARLERVNRDTQQLLNRTITERFAKTSHQAKLLRLLQDEVSAVEQELGCDISLLRDKIDECNRKLLDAQRRNDRAEQEYVAAKLDLQNCVDLKEGLEEHLFTIIKLNETKKSEKLELLNQKLSQLDIS